LYFTRLARHISIKFRGVHYVNLWGVGIAARTIWASAIMADKAEGLAGTQVRVCGRAPQTLMQRRRRRRQTCARLALDLDPERLRRTCATW
jgi:hypothetical protein